MNDWENKATESPRCQIQNVSRTWVLEFSKILVVSFVNRLTLWKIGCLLKHQRRKTWPINHCSLRGSPMIGAPHACRSTPMIAVATVLSSGICQDSCGHCTMGCLNIQFTVLYPFWRISRIFTESHWCWRWSTLSDSWTPLISTGKTTEAERKLWSTMVYGRRNPLTLAHDLRSLSCGFIPSWLVGVKSHKLVCVFEISRSN